MVDSLRSIVSPKLSVSRTNVWEEEGERFTGRRHFGEEFEEYGVVTFHWCSFEMKISFDPTVIRLKAFQSVSLSFIQNRLSSFPLCILCGFWFGSCSCNGLSITNCQVEHDSFTVISHYPYCLVCTACMVTSHWIVGGGIFP